MDGKDKMTLVVSVSQNPSLYPMRKPKLFKGLPNYIIMRSGDFRGRILVLIAALLLTLPLISSLGYGANATGVLNTSVANSSTSIPIAYRAIVGIILIVIIIIIALKFAKAVISGLIILLLLIIIISTAYYFFQTGTISVHNSLAFLQDIYNFFTSSSYGSALVRGAVKNTTSGIGGYG